MEQIDRTLILFSSSSFLENDFLPILGKPLKDYRLAQVITASKGSGVTNSLYLDNTRNFLRKHGCYFEDLDIDGKTESDLRNILQKFDGVIVNGGNTFYLLKSIRESGFDKVIKELLPQGFLYMGGSAGAIVACPTIETSTWNPDSKYGHHGVTDLTGMNLVPFLLRVHYSSEQDVFIKEGIIKTKFPVRILTDDQAILVKGDEIKFLGKGIETLL